MGLLTDNPLLTETNLLSLFVFLYTNFFFCDKKGNRGISSDGLIIDEASYVDPDVWQHNILPLLTVDGTPVVAMSTPSDSGNYYSTLFDENSLFLRLQIGLACEICIANRKPSECVHKLGEMPFWKGATTQKEIRSLQSNDDYLRESMGVITDGGAIKTFDNYYVDKFFNLPRFSYSKGTGVIFVCIDPNGGSLNRHVSEMVLVSIAMNKMGNYVVIFFFFF